MSLASGTHLGPYEILTPLGAGGMGEVYRARDSKLKREVALKVLPELFVLDGQRMARFEREAQVLASLNHPNIAVIYGAEEANGVHALAMELVEGPTLAERIRQEPVAADEGLPIAKQIAEALEYAHEKGIIHRDLKPANIKLTRDGQVKVLDFGLAKALDTNTSDSSISTSPTISTAATRAGTLLGTAAYMSPEQAKGKAVDRRADIWAFGCVLFEMLAGKPAFDGETITDTLAAVVRAEPEWELLPKAVPRRISELLHRCLQKDVKQRLQAIGEARILLEKPGGDAEAEATITPEAKSTREHRLMGALAGAVFLAAILGFLYVNRAEDPARVIRATIQPAANSDFSLDGHASGFALSPDGKRLAYIASRPDGKRALWVRAMDASSAQPLASTEGAGHPFWSPDSRFIAFFADGKLKKIDASGGPPFVLCEALTGRGGTWNAAGVIVFTPSGNAPLYRVDAAGGAATEVTKLDSSRGESSNRWPFFLPDGKHFLYLAGSPYVPKDAASNEIRVGSLDSKESKLLLHTRSEATYSSGHLLFLRQNSLMAQAFDARRMELTGEANPVANDVQEDEPRAHGLFSASQNGLLTYAEGFGSIKRQLIWLDRSGKNLGELTRADSYDDVRFSPEGNRLALTVQTGGRDIWIEDISRAVKTRLTFGSASSQSDESPVWSPDGRWLAYDSFRGGKYGLYKKAADGSGNEEILLEAGDQPRFVTDWSADGQIAYYEMAQGVWNIWMLPMSGDKRPYPFVKLPFSSVFGRFSPDGKWLAYCSAESGRMEVYVVSFPSATSKRQISSDGGCQAIWRRDGKEIFYVATDNKIMAADVRKAASSLQIGTAKPLFETRPSRTGGWVYDITPDGQRFLVNYLPEQPGRGITLVVNWDAELKKK